LGHDLRISVRRVCNCRLLLIFRAEFVYIRDFSRTKRLSEWFFCFLLPTNRWILYSDHIGFLFNSRNQL